MLRRLPPALWGVGLITAGLGLVLGWSMLTETLLPLARQGAYAELALNCLGLPVLVLGVGVFVWGGLVFVARTNGLLGEEAFTERAIKLRERSTPATERQALERAQLRAFGQAWGPGLAWLATGAGLIAVGSLLINWLPGWLGLRH